MDRNKSCLGDPVNVLQAREDIENVGHLRRAAKQSAHYNHSNEKMDSNRHSWNRMGMGSIARLTGRERRNSRGRCQCRAGSSTPCTSAEQGESNNESTEVLQQTRSERGTTTHAHMQNAACAYPAIVVRGQLQQAASGARRAGAHDLQASTMR